MRLIAVLLASLALPLAAQSADCDRACLKSTLDTYMTAVVKHDPKAAPLMQAYRHTENALNKPLGQGVWQSVTALGKVQRRYVDASGISRAMATPVSRARRRRTSGIPRASPTTRRPSATCRRTSVCRAT